MTKYGVDYPETSRQTALYHAEEWYQRLLSERLQRPYEPILRSDFGRYNMAVHYLTSIFEEAKAIEKVAVYNIDHMAQINFYGKDASALLDRVLPINMENMTIGQCKYTLLLNENGTVRDDMIIMKQSPESYILVINAGHDFTGNGFVSDADFIMNYLKPGEDVKVKDISDLYVKVDIQGIYSFKLITEIFGADVLKSRSNPEKNMGFFSFNEIEIDKEVYFFSRTGYTNRWGWEIYIPIKQAEEMFKKIVLRALELGGFLVGLGGRDENRISAGNVGLPLMGSEYCGDFTPTNAPLFNAAINMAKDNFVGKSALEKDKNNTQTLVLIIAEGNIIHNGVYIDGKRVGRVTSSIISPNVPLEKRLHIGSSRKNVNEKDGTAAIALAWLNINPYTSDSNEPIRLKVDLYREKDGVLTGKPILGYISSDGVNPATASKPLKAIENL